MSFNSIVLLLSMARANFDDSRQNFFEIIKSKGKLKIQSLPLSNLKPSWDTTGRHLN